MRAYLAAPYAARATVLGYAQELERIGIKVTSSWLHEEHEINAGTTGAAAALPDTDVSQHAVQDLEDIRYSDLLVLFTPEVLGMTAAQALSGGRHVETGFALALDKPVLVVGEPENVFHRLRGGWSVDVVPSWHEAVVELAHRAVVEAKDAPRRADV